MDNKRSSLLGIDANIVLILTYVISIILYLLPGACYFAWGIPLLLYIFENKNEYVRKQAVQAVMWFLLAAIFSLIMSVLKVALNPLDYVQYLEVTLVSFRAFLAGVLSGIEMVGNVIIIAFSVIAMIRIYSYFDYYIPVVGKYIKHFRKIVDIVVGEVNYDDSDDITNDRDIVSVGELKENINYVSKKGSKSKDKVEKEDKDNGK